MRCEASRFVQKMGSVYKAAYLSKLNCCCTGERGKSIEYTGIIFHHYKCPFSLSSVQAHRYRDQVPSR